MARFLISAVFPGPEFTAHIVSTDVLCVYTDENHPVDRVITASILAIRSKIICEIFCSKFVKNDRNNAFIRQEITEIKKK